MMNEMHMFHAPQTQLTFLDSQKMLNTLRNFILEMEFSKLRTQHLERVEMDFSMAVPMISVEQVRATVVVIPTTLMMSQMFNGICPMTILIEVSLQVLVHDHILLARWILALSHTVVMIAHASHWCRDDILSIADVAAARITLPAVTPSP